MKDQEKTKRPSVLLLQIEWLCFSILGIETLHKILFDKRVALLSKLERYCFKPTTSLSRRGVGE